MEIPFNAPPDRPTRIFIDTGKDVFGSGITVEEFRICDQYTIQGDIFSGAVRGLGDVPTPLEDSLANMTVIESLLKAERAR